MKKRLIVTMSLLCGMNVCIAMDRQASADLLHAQAVSVCVTECCSECYSDFCPVENRPICPRMCYAATKWGLLGSMIGCGFVALATSADAPNQPCCCALAALCVAARGVAEANRLIHVSESAPARERIEDERLDDMQTPNSKYVCRACHSVLDSVGIDEEVGLRLSAKKKK